MKMIEITDKHGTTLINKNKISAIIYHLDDLTIVIHLGKKHVTLPFENSLAAKKFYQRIRDSLLPQIEIIQYDEKKGVL